MSPVSLHMALAMTYIGARGLTAEQMAAALHLPKDQDAVKIGFRQLLSSLKVNGCCEHCCKNGKAWAYLRDLIMVSFVNMKSLRHLHFPYSYTNRNMSFIPRHHIFIQRRFLCCISSLQPQSYKF